MASTSLFHNLHPAMDDMNQSSEAALLTTLTVSPSTFLQAPPGLHSASLVCAKRFLDPLASTISELQAQRQKEARKKRKRGQDDIDDVQQTLQLNQIYCDGFAISQIWEQARRVLDAAEAEVDRDLFQVSDNLKGGRIIEDKEETNISRDNDIKMLRFDDDGFEMDDSDDEILSGDSESHDDDSINEVSEIRKENNIAGYEEEEEALENLIVEDSELGSEISAEDGPQEEYVQDPNDLNDGFFSIDDFNKQSEFLEQQDARGDPDDSTASDDEDIDWTADPLSMAMEGSSKAHEKTHEKDDDNADDDEEDDGPTFDDMDLDPDSEDDDGEELSHIDGLGAMQNTNNIMYKDFFEPPPRKTTKSKRMRALPKTQPNRKDPRIEQGDIQRAMSDVRRDLFEDDLSEENGEDEDISDDNSKGKPPQRSTHEEEKAKLAEEIRRLEAANVAKRDWTLSGEARAVDRPVNALLEEDLDFERGGKPLPVITNEVSEDLEALIKRRILAQDFDELIRRRLDSLTTPDTRRGRFELEDTKNQKSLAELYEEDHLRTNDPNFIDKRDEKLKKEHSEIEALWNDVSAKLDALSNWRYKPKPPQASINVISDVATISMEDARPTAGAEAGASMLAPQEVYAPGEDRSKGEIVPKTGAPLAKEEMTKEQKLRRRRREKERTKKSLASKPPEKTNTRAKEKGELLSDLKRGGVKVIGKKGDVKDVEGKAIKSQDGPKGAGGYKL
ncbi:MAG: U3 snoRNP protein [Cirrosporium novae-zelandiae]|nr:MAG: U3 snoRNP protein [Cirrosporium novae-zelandiae]